MHCETRWLSLRRAINSTLEMCDPLFTYFTSHDEVEKPDKVKDYIHTNEEAVYKGLAMFSFEYTSSV